MSSWSGNCAITPPLKRRQVIIGASSGAAAALATSSMLAGGAALARPTKEAFGRTLSVRDVGARGDGVHDDTEAIQAAIDEAEAVYLPAGVYRITRAIRLRSNRHVFGAGAATLVRNDQTADKPDERSAFLLGDHHPAAFRRDIRPDWRYPTFALKPVRETDSTVTLITQKDVGALQDNEFVWLRSAEEVNFGEWVNPHYLQLTKVDGIDKQHGTIELADPAEFTIQQAYLSPIRAIDPYLDCPFFAVENVTIENMFLDAYTWGGLRYCAYRCLIRDLEIKNACHILVGNCLTQCLVENIKGTFVQRFIEIKNGTSWSHFRNIRGRYLNPSGLEVSRPWETGERAFGLTFEDCHLTLDVNYPSSLPAVEIKTTMTKLVRCTVRDARLESRQIVVHVPHARGPSNRRIAFDGVEIFANGPRAYVLVGSTAAQEDYLAPGLVTVRGCGFRDAAGNRQYIVVQGGAHVSLVANEFDDGEVLLEGGQASFGENVGLRTWSRKSDG